MACFDKDELADCIRHNLATLDEAGLVSRILKPRRKAPPGGLPLEMCRKEEEEEGGEEGEGDELGPGPSSSSLGVPESSRSLQPPPIRDWIRAKLLSKLEEMEKSGRVSKAAQPVAQRPTECTLRFEPKQMPGEGENGQKPVSMTSRLLAETQLEDEVQSFAEFAKFEAMEGSPGSKRFQILFPFAEQSHLAIPIQIIRTATISELIGLACHIYTREEHQPPCGSPDEYDLYLAEEDLEDYDTELPPQDRRRRVAECGFPNLAMVKRGAVNRRPSQRIQSHQINIFLVDGRCYTMDTQSLDISLGQVLGYALERKREEEDEQKDGEGRREEAGYFRKMDYILEPLDQPGVSLSLDCSVSSSGTNEFVLLRMNSARGEALLARQPSQSTAGSRPLQTRSMEFSQFSLLDVPSRNGSSKPSTPTSTTDWTKRRTRFSLRQSRQQQQHRQQQPFSIEIMATLGRRSGAELAQMMLGQALLDGGAQLGQFQVNRIHRFQPKTPSLLVVRERCLELAPLQTPSSADEPKKMKKASSPSNNAKTKRIPWELVAAVEVPPNSEQRANARRIVRIICLSGLAPALVRHIIDSGKAGKPPEGNFLAYEGAYWKTFLVEAAAEEAWQIGVRLSELLDSRPSQVHVLYNYSAGATLKPQSALEKAFGLSKSLPKTGHSPGNSSISGKPSIGGEKGPKKKMSMIFSRMRV